MQQFTGAVAADQAISFSCLGSGTDDHWCVARILVGCYGILAADVARRQQLRLLGEGDFAAAATWGAVFHAILERNQGARPPREEIN